MKNAGKWALRILGSLVLLLVIVLVFLGFMPVPEDEKFAEADYGAGASSVAPSYTGLQREFPPLNEPAENPSSDEKVALGKLLFFDPVLSGDNTLSCAGCHHPDFGFSDGQRHAIGFGGEGAGPDRTGGLVLTRNTLSIWNTGYTNNLFWDGRASTLEEQAVIPITADNEMAVADTAALVTELQSIDEYVALFEAAFPGESDPVTFENVTFAIAAFERTLISNESPFDRYAEGDIKALTQRQKRGLTIYRSAATRCFECHVIPTFGSETFRVVGVPSMLPDEGAGEGAFKVPALRNIALTAPYMHNGAFETLEEVVQFYADGGGRAQGMENVDAFVAGFELSDQEIADLIAFLHALTDKSGMPEIPDEVPSGLPVVPRISNPARDAVSSSNTSTFEGAAEVGDPVTITVQPDETVQAAVDRAKPGDTILIPFGTYHERVAVDISNLTIHGIPNANGDWPIFDGKSELSEAIISSGNNFEVGFLQVKNYTRNGILTEGSTGVYMHDTYVENTGIYGLYPVQSTDVLVERNEVTGANDAGIYTGQCTDVVIRDNVVYGNVLGIEVENTVGAEIYNNHAFDNTMGIFIDLLPQLTSKVSLNTKVYDNLLEDNNHPNFAREGTSAALAPAGTGIAIFAADYVEVYNNIIKGNKSAGVGVFHMNIGFDEDRINVPGTPENNYIHDNMFENNGFDPDPFVSDLGIPGADILWDGTGINNRFDEPDAQTFPPALPSSKWPTFFYNMYWQVLNFLTGLL